MAQSANDFLDEPAPSTQGPGSASDFLGPEPQQGALSYIGNRALAGGYGAIRGIGETLQGASEMGGGQPGVVANTGKALEEYATPKEEAAVAASPEEGQGTVAKYAGKSAQAILGMAPLAAAGTVGSVVGPAGTAAGMGAQAAAQTFHEEYQNALKLGMSDDDARAHAWKSAAVSGGTMAAFPAVGEGLGFAGGVLKNALSKAAPTALDAAADITGKTLLPEFAKSGAEMMGANQIVGAGQQAGQQIVNNQDQVGKQQTPWQAVKAGAEQTLEGGAAFLPLSFLHARAIVNQSAAVKGAIENGDAAPGDRQVATQQIFNAVKKVDPDSAQNFKDYAADAIANKQPITLDPDIFKAAQPAEQPGPPLGLPNRPNPAMYAFSDGSVGTQDQIDQHLSFFPENQRPHELAKLMYGSQEIEPDHQAVISGALPYRENATMYAFSDGSTGTQAQIDAHLNSLAPEQRASALAKMMQGAQIVDRQTGEILPHPNAVPGSLSDAVNKGVLSGAIKSTKAGEENGIPATAANEKPNNEPGTAGAANIVPGESGAGSGGATERTGTDLVGGWVAAGESVNERGAAVVPGVWVHGNEPGNEPVTKGDQHAISEPRAGSVLQREQGQAGITGSERRGVEQGIERNQTTGAGAPAAEVWGKKAVQVDHFDTPEEYHLGRFNELAAQHGLTPEQVKGVFHAKGMDSVTGFHREGELKPMVERAQEYVKTAGRTAHFVDADIANLGGINNHFKNVKSDADRIYRGISDIFKEELDKAGKQEAIPVRKGGDEISAVVIGSTDKSVKEAIARAKERIAAYVKEQGLSDLPHPKGGTPGVGLHMGSSPIKADRSFEAIEKEAALGIDQSKAAAKKVLRADKAANDEHLIPVSKRKPKEEANAQTEEAKQVKPGRPEAQSANAVEKPVLPPLSEHPPRATNAQSLSGAAPIVTKRDNGTISVTGRSMEEMQALRDKLGIRGAIIGKNGNAIFPKSTNVLDLKRELGVSEIPKGTILAEGNKPFTKRGDAVKARDEVKGRTKTHEIIPVEDGYGIAPRESPLKKAAGKKADTLLTALRDMGGVRLDSKNDVVGDKFAPGGYNQVFTKNAQHSIEGLVGKGELDEYLPYNLRFSTHDNPNSEVADMQEAVEWIKDKIRSGERVIPYDAQMELDQKDLRAQDAIDAVAEELTHDEINTELQLAADEERENASNAQVFNAHDENGGIERSQGTEGRERLELQGQTPVEVANQERAQRESEQRQRNEEAQAKKDQAAKDQANLDARTKARAANPDNFQFGESSKEAAKPIGDLFNPPEPKAEQLAKDTGKISDFGEKIEGAKKDLWQNYKKAMSDELPASVRDITLSKHFPEPDYENLIANGTDIRTIAAIKAMRDEIPTKPQNSYKLQRWGEQLKQLRDFSNKLIDGSIDTDHALQKMREVPALHDIADRIEMYADLGYPAFKSAKGYGISGGWTRPGRTGEQFGLKTPEHRVSFFDTRQEAVDALRAKLETAPETTEGGRSTKLDIYRVTKTGDIVIGKKVASNKYIDLQTGFKSSRDAREYLQAHEKELLELLDKKKDVVPDRRSVNNPRVGADYRQGEDVTPEKFASEFGWRGVQFGNYVEQGRRQRDLNNAYDALLDMAHTIGVPSRALSLNGELGLAFGARGGGSKAAAHYEPEQVVINLTKTQGFGSLGHEFFHALDNYFSREAGKKDAFITSNPKAYEGGKTRPEVIEAFSNLMQAIQKSEFYKDALKLDNRRTNNYWSTNLELAARSFESYLVDKAAEKGESNDYLANIIPEEAHKAILEGEPYQYPTKTDKAVLNPLFDKLFATLKTKETDKGIALFSRDAQPETNHTPATIAKALRDTFGGITDKLLERGEQGKRGGVVLAKDIDDAAKLFAEKTGRTLEEVKGQLQNSVAKVDADSLKNKLNAAIKGDDETKGRPITVSDSTPASLRIFGWNDLPVVMRAGADGAMKMFYQHGLSASDMAHAIAKGLDRPVMMFQHLGQRDVESVWLVTDKTSKGQPVIIAVHPESESATGKVHLIATALSHPWDAIARKIKNGDLLYRDTTARTPDTVKISIAEAQRKYAQEPRSLLGVLPNSAPVRGRAYKVLSQSDLVKHEATMDIQKSEDGHVQGFYDPKSGLSFLVSNRLDEAKAPGVLAHEIMHGTDTAEIQQRAVDLIGRRDDVTTPLKTREFLKSVADRMTSAAVEGDEKEAASYIVEQALLTGRKDGFSAIDGTLFAHLTDKLGKRVGDFVRDWVAKVRAALFSRGVDMKLTVDDMTALAHAGMKQAAQGNVNTEGAQQFSKGAAKPFSRAIKQDEVKPVATGVAAFMEKSKSSLDSIKTGFGELKDAFASNPTYNDKQKIIGEYTGKLQMIDHELSKFAKRINAEIPKDRQEAITNYMQAGGDEALLRQRAADSKPAYRKGYQDALKLTGKEKAMAKEIQDTQDKFWKQANEAGILEGYVTNYVRGQWERETPEGKKIIALVNSGMLNDKPREAMQKVFQSYFDGEKAGYVPTDKRIGYQFVAAQRSIRAAIAARKALTDLMNSKEADGRPTVSVGGAGRAIESDSEAIKALRTEVEAAKSALRKNPDDASLKAEVDEKLDKLDAAIKKDEENYKDKPFFVKPNVKPTITEKDKEGKVIAEHETRDYKYLDHPSMRSWKWVGTDTAGSPILMQGNMYIHPDAYGKLNALLGKSKIRTYEIPKSVPMIGGTRPGNAMLKAGAYIKSTMLSGTPFHQFHVGEHAIFHGVNPMNTPELDFDRKVSINGKEYKLLQEGVNHGMMVYNHNAIYEFGEGLAGGGLLHRLPVIGDGIQRYGEYLFQDYIPRLKAAMFEKAVMRAAEHEKAKLASGKITMDQIFAREAQHSNDAFGEQNYKYLGRDPTIQDAMRLLLLAPDFLESRLKFAGAALTPSGREQRIALIKGALIMGIGAQAVNILFGDDHKTHWDKPFSAIIGGREYSPRSVVGDMAHAITDPRGFWYNRINPLWSKPIIELASGRNQYGQKEVMEDSIKNTIKSWAPLPAQGLFKTNTGQTTAQSIYGALLGSIGMTNKLYKTPVEKEISDIAFGHMQMGAESPSQKRRYEEFSSLKDAYMTGALSTIRDVAAKAKADGVVISTSQLRQIELSRDATPQAKEKLLEHKMKDFSPEEAIDVWGKMSDDEKPLYERFMLNKIARSRMLTVQEKREAIMSLRQ